MREAWRLAVEFAGVCLRATDAETLNRRFGPNYASGYQGISAVFVR